MKTRELELLADLEAEGIPPEVAKRVVPWQKVRENPKLRPKDLGLDIARNLTRLGAVQAAFALPIDIGDVLKALEFLIGLIPGVEPPPPRPQTIPGTSNTLVWCERVLIATIAEGENARVEADDNGMTLNPLDTDGTVELTNGDGKSIGRIRGNGSVVVRGPTEIWAHLTGGTQDDPAEDKCTIKVEVSKFGPVAR